MKTIINLLRTIYCLIAITTFVAIILRTAMMRISRRSERISVERCWIICKMVITNKPCSLNIACNIYFSAETRRVIGNIYKYNVQMVVAVPFGVPYFTKIRSNYGPLYKSDTDNTDECLYARALSTLNLVSHMQTRPRSYRCFARDNFQHSLHFV